MGIEYITWKKIIPLGFMFFCILFNYTILRDTKVGAVLHACMHRAPLCGMWMELWIFVWTMVSSAWVGKKGYVMQKAKALKG